MLSLFNLKNSSSIFLDIPRKNTRTHDEGGRYGLRDLSNTQRANHSACDFQPAMVRGDTGSSSSAPQNVPVLPKLHLPLVRDNHAH
jgi:hypothetical protein